jgi:hypothetical protein
MQLVILIGVKLMLYQPRKTKLFITTVAIVGLTLTAAVSVGSETVRDKTKLRVEVMGVRTSGGAAEPIAGADVLVKSQTEDFEELATTDGQGVAQISDVPYGKTLIQVTAEGFQTNGQTHELKQKEHTIKVELKPADAPPEASPTPTPTP